MPMSERTSQERKTIFSKRDERTRQDRRAFLRDEYREVCTSHAGITDFRAKLLALLPVASGTGIGLLIFQVKTSVSEIPPGLLVGLGVFGALVTAGLFVYELRQIDVCKQLRNRAAYIERQFGEEAGQFGGRRGLLALRDAFPPNRKRDEQLGDAERVGKKEEWPKGRLGAETAGYIVYGTVFCGWVVVFALGVWKVA
jgi:hypothetical protein